MTPPPVTVAERNQALMAVVFSKLHPRQPPDPGPGLQARPVDLAPVAQGREAAGEAGA